MRYCSVNGAAAKIVATKAAARVVLPTTILSDPQSHPLSTDINMQVLLTVVHMFLMVLAGRM